MTSRKSLSRVIYHWSRTDVVTPLPNYRRLSQLASTATITATIDQVLAENDRWVKTSEKWVASHRRTLNRTHRKEAMRVAEERIVASLLDRRWRFRTPEGIARELDIPVGHVRRVLETRADIARKVDIPVVGTELFTHATRRPSVRERLTHLLTIGAKQPIRLPAAGRHAEA
jgi:hypothetical protein